MKKFIFLFIVFPFILNGQVVTTYYRSVTTNNHVYDTSTIRILSQMSSQTDGRKILIDSTVRRLKKEGLWDKLDLLYMFAASDSTSAMINWKSKSYKCVSVGGTPAFTTDAGFKFSTGKAFNTNYRPYYNAVKMGLTDVSIGVYIYESSVGADQAYDIGSIESGIKWLGIASHYTYASVPSMFIDANTGWVQYTDRFGETGLYSVSRRGSGQYIARYMNGVYVDSVYKVAAAAMPTPNLCIGAYGSGNPGSPTPPYSQKGYSYAFLGAGFSPAQQTSFYAIMGAYLTFPDYYTQEVFRQAQMSNSIVWKQETGFLRKNPFGSLEFLCPGSSFVITVHTELYNWHQIYSYLRIEENNSGTYTYYKCKNNYPFKITLSGTNNIVEITEPFTSDPYHLGNCMGNFISSIKIIPPYSGYSVTYYKTTPARKMLFLGNSITVGGNDSTNHAFRGFSMIFRNNRKTGCDAAVLGYGHGSISLYAPDSAIRMKFTNHIDSLMNGTDTNKLVILLGTNDFALAYTDTTNFKNWYSILLNDIHAKRADIKICVISPLRRGDETKSGSRRCTLPEYRDIVRRVCLGRNYVTYIDGYPLLDIADLYSDQLHPSTAGHFKLYNNLKTRSFFTAFTN